MSSTQRRQGHGQHHHMPDQEGFDLSMLHPLAHDASHIPVEQLTKSEQVQPWNGQRQNEMLYQQLSASAWQHDTFSRPYARTEPLQTRSAGIHMRRNPSQNPSDADSGYISQPMSFGAEYLDVDTFACQSNGLSDTVHWEHVPDNASTWPPPPQTIVSDTAAHPRIRRESRKPSLTPCQHCQRLPKNHSDAKKHAETHLRRWKCETAGCTRKDGFATLNDLERHRKSVHSLRPSVGSVFGYICQECVQKSEGRDRKFWPRRDNFKAHIRRRHPRCDEAHLLDISKTQRPDDATTADIEEQSVVSFAELPQDLSPSDPREAAWRSAQQDDAAQHQNPFHDEFSPLFPASGISEDPLAAMGSQIDMQHNEHTYWPMPMPIGSIMEEVHEQPMSSSFPTSQYYMIPAQQASELPHVDNAAVTDNRPWSPTQIASQTSLSSPRPIPACSEERSPRQIKTEPGNHPCPNCFKLYKRECDLKKHLKRHTRPYGCTFPRCNKDFGSRNDWKRHESTQHQSPRHRQVRKQGQNSNLGHGALSQTIGEAEMTTSFWCGFCVAMIHCDEDVTQVQARLGSDSENFLARRRTDKTMARLVTELRIQHVGDHYDKQSRGIKDWVSLDVFVKGEREAEGLGTEVPRLSKEDVVCKQEQEVAEMSWVPGAGLDHKFEQGD
ncbi:unnamed protein product [Cercospora beticola]|nr:unnamed protein product [Cercospora beticola]